MPAGFNDPFAEDLGTPTIGVKPQASDPFVSDLGKPRFVDGTEQRLEQGESDNFLNRIVKGIRDFLHIDTHKGDFPKLLAIERYGSATDENLQKIYDDLGWSPKYYDEVVSKFFNNVTLGIVPQEKLPQPTTATGKVALSLANSVSGLAGFVVADAMLGGTLDTVAKLFTQARHVGIMEKLGVLRKYAPSIASMRPRANLISSVLGSGLRLGLDTALVNIVNANERTNNIWEAIKDVEPEALQNALFGAGLPILGSIEKPVVRAMLALGLGNTTSFLVTGKTDLQGIADGVIASDPKELTESLFNTLLDVYFGYTAHTNEFKEDENTKAMGDVAHTVELKYQTLEEKPSDLANAAESLKKDLQFAQEVSAKTPTEAKELIEKRAQDEGLELQLRDNMKPIEMLDSYFQAREEALGIPQPTKMYGGIPLSEWKKPFKDLLEKHTLPTVEKDISKLTFALVDPFHAQYVVDSPEGREVFKALNKAIETTETKMYKIRNELGDRLLALQEVNTKTDSHLLEIAKKALVWADKEQKDPMEYVANNYPNADRKQLQTIFNNYYNVTKYIRDATNRRTNEVIKRLKDVGVKSDKLEYMKKVMYSQIGELEYYMPRVRKPGNLIINAYKDGKRIYSKPISDVFTLVFPNRSVVAKHYEKILKERYGEDIDIEVKYPRQRLDISKLDIYSVMDAVHEALTDLPKEQARAVIDKLIENLKAQGFMAHSIRRKDELVEGYEENPFKALQSSVSMFTGYIQKQYLRDELTEIRKAVSPRTPNLYKAINNVTDELLRQKDATDKIVNTVRGLLFIKYLGLSLRNGFVNVAFQPIFTGMHLAAEYGKGNVPNYGKAQAELAKAATDYMSGNLTEKEKRVMEKLDEWGVTKAQKTHYMLAKSALNDSLWWNKLTNAAGFIMEKTEQFNRATAALAFIRVRNRAEELTINELATLAKEFVYLTNGKYGDSNLPMMFQGKGEFKRWARIGQTFQTYNHQQLLGMLKLWKEGHRSAVLAGMGLLMILGGMSTLPMYETVKEVYRHVTGGRDLEVDIANGIGTDKAYKLLHEGIIGTVFGVDVSSSASLSMPTDELKFMGDSLGDKMANLVFGVGYQSVKDMFKATSYMASGDWYKAFYYGIPARFLSYPIKAMQEYKFGVTTKGDVLLVDPETGKPLQLTAKEAILQALGFTPERIARYMNTLYMFKSIDSYFQKKRTQLYNKYRVAYSKGDIDGMRKAVKEMLELNERIAKLNRSGYNIAPANVERINTIYHNKRLLQFMQSQLHY